MEDRVRDLFLELIDTARSNKPDDRTPRSRCFAVLLTMLEQAYAYYHLYIYDPE
jgi:hypothetical protein